MKRPPPPDVAVPPFIATSRKGWVFQCFGSTNEGRGGPVVPKNPTGCISKMMGLESVSMKIWPFLAIDVRFPVCTGMLFVGKPMVPKPQKTHVN